MHKWSPLRGPGLFWPLLLFGAVVMLGWSILSLVTGPKGTVVLGSSAVGSQFELPRAPDDSPVRIWINGGDLEARQITCSFPDERTSLFDEFSPRTMVGPDGRTYVLSARISGPYRVGAPVTCTSPSSATDLLLAQDAGRTTWFTTIGAGIVGLGGLLLALVGFIASRRQRASLTPPSAGQPPASHGW